MIRSVLVTTAVVAATIGIADTARAATQEYQITAPVTVKITPKSLNPAGAGGSGGAGLAAGKNTSGLPVTVNCAVGDKSIALVGGQATNAAGSGSVQTRLPSGPGGFSGNVTVTFTAADDSKPAGTYLCWVVVDPSALAQGVQMPVNFVTGPALDKKVGTAVDNWIAQP
jgi:hypothetical protein